MIQIIDDQRAPLGSRLSQLAAQMNALHLLSEELADIAQHVAQIELGLWQEAAEAHESMRAAITEFHPVRAIQAR